jgi:hypothetical protein
MRNPLLLLTAALAMAGTTAANPGDVSSKTVADDEGLVSVDVPGLNHVYARPGAHLSGYTKIMLDPVEVSFNKSSNPEPRGSSVTVAQKQTIKMGLAKLLRQELANELVRSGRYSLVGAAEEGVLRIRAEIRDLDINMPALPRAAADGNYSLSVRRIRLVAELRDAPTGALIARVVDFKKDPQSAWMQLTRPVNNIAATRRAAAHWAQILRGQLDAAQRVVGPN